MKGYKELLNEVANHSNLRKLSDDELCLVKACTLDIFKKISQVCDDHGLCIMLGGGSALGAVRHKGFIPWDDDMDLNMPRKDYNCLLQLCEEGVLGDEYDFTFPSKEHDSPSAFLQIWSKKCFVIGLSGLPHGICIDVFPIEGAPSNKFVWKTKGYIANVLRLIMNMVGETGKWSEPVKTFYAQDKKFYRFMRCRQFLGRLFSFVSHKQWVCWYDSFVKCENIGDLAVIPTGRKLYHGETLPSSIFFPVSKGVFEGLEVNLPANPDAYLKNLYGDYMKIPPVEKRESHMIVSIEYKH